MRNPSHYRTVILHSVDPFSKRTGRNANLEIITKKAEKSYAVSDTRSSVMKIVMHVLVCAARRVIRNRVSSTQAPGRCTFENPRCRLEIRELFVLFCSSLMMS